MLHLDVKKLGRIPEGGGKRLAPGFAETRSGPHPQRSLGLEYLHVTVDDHSRYAHVAALPDERGATCAAFLEQALAVFSQPRRARTTGADRQREGLVRDSRTAAATAAPRKLWAAVYAHSSCRIWMQRSGLPFVCGAVGAGVRLRQLPRWLYRYTHRRPHGGVGGAVPASRL